VKYRLLEISRAAKSQTKVSQKRMRASYYKLLALTRKVVRQASEVIERLKERKLPVIGNLLMVEVQAIKLQHFLPLVEKVIAQTRERVWGGNTRVEGKVLSLFESHTQVIRKGKAHKPNELGRLVRVDEVENGIVSGYKVSEGNQADTNSWLPAIQQHQAWFGKAPQMATADRGFFSAKNEQEAKAWGVERVALPARGRLSKTRAQHQKERWFKRALRWRAGSEATISHLKNPFSLKRATYKGEPGFQRFVGWCMITKNLFSMARYQERRKRAEENVESGILRPPTQTAQ
jgi:IS5 family transposase